jgi:hypothetical protein
MDHTYTGSGKYILEVKASTLTQKKKKKKKKKKNDLKVSQKVWGRKQASLSKLNQEFRL